MARHGHHSLPTRGKAKKMLRHGEVRGKPLTGSQKGLMGLLAGGGKPTRLKKKRDRRLERR